MVKVIAFFTQLWADLTAQNLAPVPVTREELEAEWHRLYDANLAAARKGQKISREDAAAEDRAYSLYSTAMVNLRRA